MILYLVKLKEFSYLSVIPSQTAVKIDKNPDIFLPFYSHFIPISIIKEPFFKLWRK